MRLLLPIIALAASGLAACQPSDAPSENFGVAVRQNMQAHIINPEPAEAGELSMDGSRAASGVTRYQTNKTYPPQSMNAVIAAPTTSQK